MFGYCNREKSFETMLRHGIMYCTFKYPSPPMPDSTRCLRNAGARTCSKNICKKIKRRRPSRRPRCTSTARRRKKSKSVSSRKRKRRRKQERSASRRRKRGSPRSRSGRARNRPRPTTPKKAPAAENRSSRAGERSFTKMKVARRQRSEKRRNLPGPRRAGLRLLARRAHLRRRSLGRGYRKIRQTMTGREQALLWQRTCAGSRAIAGRVGSRQSEVE